MANRIDHMLARPLTSLDPRSHAQADADVRTIGDLQSSHVAGEIPKNAPRYSSHVKTSGIVRMNPDTDARFLRYRYNLANEKRVVVPQLFFGVAAAMRQRWLPSLARPSP